MVWVKAIYKGLNSNQRQFIQGTLTQDGESYVIKGHYAEAEFKKEELLSLKKQFKEVKNE
jgi:hypothetical protein